jgi:HEAT repeat protein
MKKIMKKTSVLFAIALSSVALPFLAQAAKMAAPAKSLSMTSTLEALQLPFDERVAQLRVQGNAGMKNLETIMFTVNETLENRWRATTALGRMGGTQARAGIERALHAREWFLRNAALVSLTQTDRASATQWARRLLADHALLVRATAVDTLANLRDVGSAPILWQNLNSRENFRGKQGLFIRRHIVEALAKIESPGTEGKFIALLSDADESLHEPAIGALEHMTSQSFQGEPRAQSAQWQRWWKTHASAPAPVGKTQKM